MPVTTVSAAVHITPVVVRTFFSHGKRKAIKYKNSEEEEATDDIFFDEAFHIVKAFIDLGINNTVESLQAFTNTHVPAPYWAAVSLVQIPLKTCNEAANVLIDWFGPEELKRVVGGERWWQVRGLNGIDAEWITEKEYLSPERPKVDLGRKLTENEDKILRMEGLPNVMLYVHGGGYFWGSINTHRYQIIRYGKLGFLLCDLYLIRPPEGALHKPIPPSTIVFAGDSAGGGLCLSVLTVLRDLGLPMPAGAVLISPWVDLTHSFPSVTRNAKTDIIPEHGFLAKPSTLWPIHPIPPEGGRIGPTKSGPPPKPGHSDTLKPSKSRVEDSQERLEGEDNESRGKVEAQADMLEGSSPGSSQREASDGTEVVSGNGDSFSDSKDKNTDGDIGRWEPKLPKVLMEDPEAVPLELRSQIQLYATNEQLTHPLVSPILQSSLGGLPPMYIIAGDGEVLRDEIIYIAHRAAHPQDYPTRRSVLKDARRQQENAEKFMTPTKVHLQVFDGMCHVLPVFMFTPSAKYAFRAIAEFVKHVTGHSQEHLERNPFPELHRPPSDISSDFVDHEEQRRRGKLLKKHKPTDGQAEGESISSAESLPDVRLFKDEVEAVAKRTEANQFVPPSQQPDGGTKDVPDVIMLRERVDIKGRTRPMEPREEIPTLRLKPGEVGLIKEAPAIRWNQGQEIWDRRFQKRAIKVIKQREKIAKKAQRMVDNAREQGFSLRRETTNPLQETRNTNTETSTSDNIVDGTIQEDRRWGPLDLDDEQPPPSAICHRRDTPEALALLKKSIYHSAPVTHRVVPKLKPADAVRAAFDPHDDPMRPPKQSVSEQQVKTHIIPMHGLKIWDALVGYFMKESAKKATDAIKATGERAGLIEETESNVKKQ
ncbi:putative lipase esterase from carbohydrate esterase family ce10 [Moniliophthora roreri MCA 2997]|uniref:Lipase esterase from carbohydrate esterase family ce10 n=1 Tax=Moniliophthora roreri (strain MCA 2997) TaxID=1381753 RepID=V2YRY9_MONRO|nr:putative lipase esterase from carbohydrate esterase family ce10 [Moniliophthora roreri MCA 2997]